MGEDDQEHKRHMRQKAFEAETSSGSRESPASWNETLQLLSGQAQLRQLS